MISISKIGLDTEIYEAQGRCRKTLTILVVAREVARCLNPKLGVEISQGNPHRQNCLDVIPEVLTEQLQLMAIDNPQ